MKKTITIGILALVALATVAGVMATKSLRYEPTEIQVDKLAMEKTCAKALATFEKKHLDHVTADLTIERDPAYPPGDDMIVHATVQVRAIE